MGNSYNGFSWACRMAKFKEMNRRLDARELSPPQGPCRLCGDPGGRHTDVQFEYHDEDYGLEYSWDEPSAYVVCRDCHIYRIHQRNAHPNSWELFLAHVRRGGYAREMREASVKSELSRSRKAILSGEVADLKELRPYVNVIGQEWFAHLSMAL